MTECDEHTPLKPFNHRLYIIGFLCLLCFIVGCKQNSTNSNNQNSLDNSPEIMVFAAASFTDVLAEITDSFEVNYQIRIKTNVASSGTLARQIAQGATPSVFISASNRWANYIDSLHLFTKGIQKPVAVNKLVLISPLDSKITPQVLDSNSNFMALLGEDRLSIGDPAHVPAGKYAKQALEYYDLYKQVNHHLLPAKDVRSALKVVEMGEVPLGIVYQTDAMKSDKVKIVGSFSTNSHAPIVYIAGVCNESKETTVFYNYLDSRAVKEILHRYGFQ